jgi:hypothetical protein
MDPTQIYQRRLVPIPKTGEVVDGAVWDGGADLSDALSGKPLRIMMDVPLGAPEAY